MLRVRDRLRLIPNGPMIPRAEVDDAKRAALRERYGAPGKALLAFFGFVYEHKGIDDLFAMLDSERHHLVIVGEVKESDPFQRTVLRRIHEPPLEGHVTLSGFLPAMQAAEVLAAADAVVLPYREGAGTWNTTLKAAALQGTFVLTTSVEATDSTLHRTSTTQGQEIWRTCARRWTSTAGSGTRRLPSSSPARAEARLPSATSRCTRSAADGPRRQCREPTIIRESASKPTLGSHPSDRIVVGLETSLGYSGTKPRRTSTWSRQPMPSSEKHRSTHSPIRVRLARTDGRLEDLVLAHEQEHRPRHVPRERPLLLHGRVADLELLAAPGGDPAGGEGDLIATCSGFRSGLS